jgi:hypothetical protein
MIRFIRSLPVIAFSKVCLLALGLLTALYVQAQSADTDQIAKAHDFVENRNWARAEAILTPLTKSQPKNPFVFYDLAQVYENTNRVGLAKQIYQGLTNTLAADSDQYTIVVRAPYASRLVSLVSLAQAKLDAINTKQTVTPQVVATIPPPPPMITVTHVPVAKENHAAVTAAMKSWAAAWANKDLSHYYASYIPSFRGELSTRTDWEKKRLDTINRETNIKINFKNVEITTLAPTRVQVRFLQSYFSDAQSSRVYKTMLFELKNGRWLIERESVK